MIEYQVVCENDPDALVTTVNEMIADGWRPVAGFAAIPPTELTRLSYYQTMVRGIAPEAVIEFKGPPSFVHPDRMPEPDSSQYWLGMTAKADPYGDDGNGGMTDVMAGSSRIGEATRHVYATAHEFQTYQERILKIGQIINKLVEEELGDQRQSIADEG